MKINIKKMYDDAIIPTRGSKQAAGYDLYAYLDNDSISLKPGETCIVKSGISVEIPEGYFAGIFARSGIAIKRNLRPANCVGVIDSDFRGEVLIAIYNDSDEERIIENKERVAQMVIMPYLNVEFNIVDELSSTERDDGRFGSTGTK